MQWKLREGVLHSWVTSSFELRLPWRQMELTSPHFPPSVTLFSSTELTITSRDCRLCSLRRSLQSVLLKQSLRLKVRTNTSEATVRLCKHELCFLDPHFCIKHISDSFTRANGNSPPFVLPCSNLCQCPVIALAFYVHENFASCFHRGFSCYFSLHHSCTCALMWGNQIQQGFKFCGS